MPTRWFAILIDPAENHGMDSVYWQKFLPRRSRLWTFISKMPSGYFAKPLQIWQRVYSQGRLSYILYLAVVLCKWGGHQISNGSLLQKVQKWCLLLIFLVCPWANPSFWEKDGWWCPDTNFGSCHQFGCVIDTRRHVTRITHPSVYYTPKVCILKPKICVWAAPRCVWWWWDTSCWGNWAVREKKFCTV